MSGGPDWVSLASVVNVAITNAQRSLVELSVRLVNQSDAERKDALVKWSERTRHELMRVLVLARWLDAIPQVQRAWRVFSLLNDVDRAMRETADLLFLARNALPNAQAPPFDVRTAIDVLANGSYDALPRCIEQLTQRSTVGVGAGVMMDRETTAAVMRRIDHALHMRLLASPTPRDLTAAQVRVDRGRLLMRVDRAYSLALTLDSDAPTERWRVLEVRLLVATAAATAAARSAATADNLDALIGAGVPMQTLQRLHAVLQQRIDAAPPDDGLLVVHDVLLPLCFELCIDALHEQARLVRQRGVTTATTSAPSLQIEYDRDVPALLVQYWCRDGAAALDDAPDDAAQQATSFARSSSAVGVRSTTNLMKLALESVAPGAAAAAAAAAAMHRSQSTMRLRAVPSTNAAAAAAASNATTDGDYAFCVTVRNGSLVVAHVPPIVADATSAALIDEAVKRLDFVALLRHVVDARAHVSLTSVARAVAHVLAEQRSLSAEPSVRASVAVQRAASNLATSGSAPPRMLLQLDGATICVLTRDRTTGAVLASEAVRDIAAFVTPAWWQAAVRVGSNEVASADAADLDTVRRGCVSLWARAALEQLRLCASARGCFAAQLRPRSVGARTAHRRQSVLLPLAGTHFESSVRVCLDDTLQPVAQLVLLSSAATVAGAVPSGATNAQFDAVAEYGERLVRCVPLSVASAVNGIDSSGGGGGGHVRRRRRLNADDAWVASALREGAALAWSTDFEAQLARLGTSHEQYMPDETTFALTLAGAATPVRCTVTRRVADETVEWLVNTDLGIVAGDASDARLRSPHLRSSGVSGTVWSFGNDVHAARGVVRTGVMSARVGAAVRSVKHAAAKAGCSVDAAGDVGVRLSLADGATRVSLGWRTDVPASGAFADAWLETNDGAIDRFFGPALRALVGAVDARSERLSGLHELLLSRVARLSDMAGALERLCAEHRDVRVVVLTLLGSVSVLVVVLQRYGIVVRSPDGRNKLRLSDATSEGATSLGNLESWSRWIDAQHSALSASGAGDLFDKLSVLRSTLIAVVRLADLARTMRARMTVSLDANGRRLTFVPANGVQNELAVNGDGSLSLMIMQSSGQPATIIVGGLDDVAAASRSISALIAAQAFLPPSLVDDALTHLARNVATLLLSLNVDGSALDGVESDSGFSRLNLTLQYYDARQQQRRLVLQLSGETGEWVWSYACVAPPPLRFVQVALFDNGTERKLGFLDNFLEAQRLVPN